MLTSALGGEKQRLAVSRVILKDPPLLFFDEAVSSMPINDALGPADIPCRRLHWIPTPNKP